MELEYNIKMLYKQYQIYLVEKKIVNFD